MRSRFVAAPFAGVVFASLLAAAPAGASDLVDVAAGAKFFAGGNVWSKPSGVPAGYDGLGFAGSGGGFGYGVGGYVEARFIKMLGLELGVVYDSSVLSRDVTFGPIKVTEKLTTTGVRIPLLVKGVLPLPGLRLWAGIGPEFLVSPSTKPELTVSSGGTLGATMTAKNKGSTLLALALGLVVDLPLSLELPLELRAAKNLSQEEAWADRVTLQTNGTTLTGYTVTAQNSWDFRLGVGVGYHF